MTAPFSTELLRISWFKEGTRLARVQGVIPFMASLSRMSSTLASNLITGKDGTQLQQLESDTQMQSHHRKAFPELKLETQVRLPSSQQQGYFKDELFGFLA